MVEMSSSLVDREPLPSEVTNEDSFGGDVRPIEFRGLHGHSCGQGEVPQETQEVYQALDPQGY